MYGYIPNLISYHMLALISFSKTTEQKYHREKIVCLTNDLKSMTWYINIFIENVEMLVGVGGRNWSWPHCWRQVENKANMRKSRNLENYKNLGLRRELQQQQWLYCCLNDSEDCGSALLKALYFIERYIKKGLQLLELSLF